jgi:hypothetical protein
MTNRFLPFLSLAVCIAGSIPNTLAQTVAAAPSSAELLSCSGLPCVDLNSPDGQVLHLAIDTGNPRSIFDTSVAGRVGLALAPYMHLMAMLLPTSGKEFFLT